MKLALCADQLVLEVAHRPAVHLMIGYSDDEGQNHYALVSQPISMMSGQ